VGHGPVRRGEPLPLTKTALRSWCVPFPAPTAQRKDDAPSPARSSVISLAPLLFVAPFGIRAFLTHTPSVLSPLPFRPPTIHSSIHLCQQLTSVLLDSDLWLFRKSTLLGLLRHSFTAVNTHSLLDITTPEPGSDRKRAWCSRESSLAIPLWSKCMLHR
jgi:hypothetical protein